MKPTKAKPRRACDTHGASGGANAWAADRDAKDTATTALARIRILAMLDTAREHFDSYALATDDPDPRMVEAADLLDATRDAMAGTSALASDRTLHVAERVT